MDRLNSDLQLKDEATTKKTQSKKGKRQDEDETDAAFHFIAFVPAMGKVWKLDGLERQPQAIGMTGMQPNSINSIGVSIYR